jgi:hypothetical protein
LWTVGVPAVTVSLYNGEARWLSFVSWFMLVAVVLEAANGVGVDRHAFRRTGRG